MPPWGHCFRRTGTDEPAVIELTQIDVKLFRLRSSLTYVGPTVVALPAGLDARSVPTSLPTSDLTSVPGPLRWFVSPYGLHTPAALCTTASSARRPRPGSTRRDADRLFRDMLDALGVPLLRRWLMWTAVAYGTRWSAGGVRRIGIVVWTVLALARDAQPPIGLVTLSLPWLLVAAVLPFPAAALWGQAVRGRAARRRSAARGSPLPAPRRRRRLRHLLVSSGVTAPGAERPRIGVPERTSS